MNISFIGAYKTIKKIIILYTIQLTFFEIFILAIFYFRYLTTNKSFQYFWFIVSTIFNIMIFMSLMFIQYKYDETHNFLKNNGYVLKIDSQKIISKEHDTIKVIDIDNIKRIKIHNQFWRGGMRIDLWIKNYDKFFRNSKIHIDDYVKRYVVKHKIPVSIYTPVLTSCEKEKLKKVLKEFKKINEIG